MPLGAPLFHRANPRDLVASRKKAKLGIAQWDEMKDKWTLIMKQIKLRIKFFVDLSTVRNENRPTSRVSPLFAAFDKLRQVNISLTTETDIRPTGLTTKVIVIWLGVFFFSAICLITVLQVDSLKIALKHLRNENIRLKSQQLKVRYQMEKKQNNFCFAIRQTAQCDNDSS